MMQPHSATLLNRALPLSGSSALLRDALIAIAATGLLTLSAKVQVPLFVPMTLQSLVVLVIGAAFGWKLGAATVLLYLAEGAMGLPVFANTPERGIGLPYMMGPTGGFLFGFLVAVIVAGFLSERGWTENVGGALAAMALGHATMFLFGFAWLAFLIGAEKAFALGVAPFYAATAIKTALGAALLPAAWWLVGRLRG